MLGDAAGLITPLCGNGMSMALHAAKLLGELLNNFLEQNQENSPINFQNRKQLEQEYEKIWHFVLARNISYFWLCNDKKERRY